MTMVRKVVESSSLGIYNSTTTEMTPSSLSSSSVFNYGGRVRSRLSVLINHYKPKQLNENERYYGHDARPTDDRKGWD
jgi:hypothetical protein